MSSEVLVALAGLAGVLLTKLVDFVLERLRGGSDLERAQLEAKGQTQARLFERIGSLEHRLDTHDERCDEKIRTAIEKSEAECDEKINRKLKGQAAALRDEFEQRLREVSEAEP